MAEDEGFGASDPFKKFNSDVLKFSSAVAAWWTITDLFKEGMKDVEENTEKQTDAAEAIEDAVEELADEVKDFKNETKSFKDVMHDVGKKFSSGMKSLQDTLGKDVVKAIDDQGGRMAKWFGTGGLLSGVNSLTGAFKVVLPLLRSFLVKWAVIAGPLLLLTNLTRAILKAIVGNIEEGRRARRQFGVGYDSEGIANLATAATQSQVAGGAIAIDAEMARTVAVNLNKELKNSSAITGEMIANIAVLEKGLGVDAAASAKFFGTALRNTEASAQDVASTFSIVAMTAEEAHLNVSDMVNTLAAAPELALQFALNTKQGQQELARSLALTQQIGISMTALRSFGDQFFDLETAATSAASLRNFGVNISSQELMLGSEVGQTAGLIENIVGQLDPNMSRMEMSALLSQNSALQGLFGNVEGLQAAQMGLKNGLSGDALTEAVSTAGMSPTEKLNENLTDYITKTQTMTSALEEGFKVIGQNIASLIGPKGITDLYDGIVELIAHTASLTNAITSWRRHMPAFLGGMTDEEKTEHARNQRRSRGITAEDERAMINGAMLAPGFGGSVATPATNWGAEDWSIQVDSQNKRAASAEEREFYAKMNRYLDETSKNNTRPISIQIDGREFIHAVGSDSGTGSGAGN